MYPVNPTEFTGKCQDATEKTSRCDNTLEVRTSLRRESSFCQASALATSHEGSLFLHKAFWLESKLFQTHTHAHPVLLSSTARQKQEETDESII